jgi:preprotein translocase subunit SecG
MQQVILVIHLMVVTALVVLVLYQKSEGGALGLGQSGLFTGRGQANALTRATAILGTIFFITSILLTVLPAWQRKVTSGDDWTTAVDQGKMEVKPVAPKEAAPPAPGVTKDKPAGDEKDSIFDQLRRAQEKRQAPPPAEAPSAGAPSEAPAAPAPAPSSAAPAPVAPAPAAPEAPKAEAPSAATPTAPAPSAAAPAEPVKPTDAAKPGLPAAQEAPKPQAAAPAAPDTKAAEPQPAPAPQAPIIWKAPTN